MSADINNAARAGSDIVTRAGVDNVTQYKIRDEGRAELDEDTDGGSIPASRLVSTEASLAAGHVAVVDVFVHMKSTAFTPVFSYAVPDTLAEVGIGDVVRVTLGKRSSYGYVMSAIRFIAANEKLKPILEKLPVPPAFGAEGLALATFVSQYYCCSLGEAISSIVYGATIPRTVDQIVALDRAKIPDSASVPERFARLVFDEFPEGVVLDVLFRHPEARRSGDRPTLRRAIAKLAEAGAIRRERVQIGPAIGDRARRVLRAGTGTIQGPKAAALVEFVATAGEVQRSLAVRAGFSPAVIARAIANGALQEEVLVDDAARFVASSMPRASTMQPTDEQAAALENLAQLHDTKEFHEVVLHGITGSGKTFVYLEFVRRIVLAGGTAIVLVPEISLTPQTARRFREIFGDAVVVLHSGLTARERYEAWRTLERGEIGVVVGARSAVFAPLPRVAAIVVDEAHETSYKQDRSPRYHAVTVARERMRRANGIVILGSATPPLEDFARARLHRATEITLHARATGLALPMTHVVDMRKEPPSSKGRVFGSKLVEALADRLDRNEKSVLFINRRGTASFILCRACGYVPNCPRCSTSLALHSVEGLLRCHICDYQTPARDRCAKCGVSPVVPLGAGTERVAEEAEILFPQARIVRMDSDTTTHAGDHARLLDEFEANGDILIGTQMIAKGLDFPTVTLAAVVAADLGLHIPDFRASERTFALLMQVAGRSGRARPGEAIVQTYVPEHPAIRYAAAHDYESFAREELADRRALRYPPYARMAYIGLMSRDRVQLEREAAVIAETMRRHEALEVLGPAFYPIARADGEWRMRIALKARSLDPIRSTLRDDVSPKVKVTRGLRAAINIDP